MKRTSAVILGLAVTGVAVAACVMKPMPPMVVSVSFWDVAVASVEGYSNPARAAALKNLDDAGASAVGATNWKANNYIGPVTYKVGSGANIVTEDKPCDKNAIDSESADAEAGTASSGGGGGYYWYGGSIFGSGGTCLYGCDPIRYGEVGEVKPA